MKFLQNKKNKEGCPATGHKDNIHNDCAAHEYNDMNLNFEIYVLVEPVSRVQPIQSAAEKPLSLQLMAFFIFFFLVTMKTCKMYVA